MQCAGVPPPVELELDDELAAEELLDATELEELATEDDELATELELDPVPPVPPALAELTEAVTGSAPPAPPAPWLWSGGLFEPSVSTGPSGATQPVRARKVAARRRAMVVFIGPPINTIA